MNNSRATAMKTLCHAIALTVVLGISLLAAMAATVENAQNTSGFVWIESQPAGLRIGLRSEMQPLAINQMHSWIIQLQTADTGPVSNAIIRVDGGMPAHNHGLATQPQVTSYLGNGNYLLEGMRFHMNGEWELRLMIEYAGREHRAVLKLQL